jgi:hypothetical protein
MGEGIAKIMVGKGRDLFSFEGGGARGKGKRDILHIMLFSSDASTRSSGRCMGG